MGVGTVLDAMFQGWFGSYWDSNPAGVRGFCVIKLVSQQALAKDRASPLEMRTHVYFPGASGFEGASVVLGFRGLRVVGLPSWGSRI